MRSLPPKAKTKSARSNWTPLRGGLPVGVGRTATGGKLPGSVGDKFAFGNTEERARLANMGCKQRGFCGQRGERSDHTTGQGYVKSQRGHYHDGIFTKRNKFDLLLHETFGGGFSPPAVAKINRLARTGFFEGRASAWQFGDPAGRRTFDAQGRDITAKKVR